MDICFAICGVVIKNGFGAVQGPAENCEFAFRKWNAFWLGFYRQKHTLVKEEGAEGEEEDDIC